MHARNVALVLDRLTDYVSTQFYVHFDPGFHTVKQNDFDSLWSVKTGFMNQIEKIGKNKLPRESKQIRKASEVSKGQSKIHHNEKIHWRG